MVLNRYLAMAVASGVAISAATVGFCLHDSGETAKVQSPSGQAAFGPGTLDLNGGQGTESLNAARRAPLSTIALSLDSDGKLIPDARLRAALDTYLLEEGGEAGMASLMEAVRAQQPADVAHAVGEIGARYIHYLQASDASLAVSGVSGSPLRDATAIAACATWLEQREHLQRETLGEKAALGMFGNDNVRLREALAVLDQAAHGHAEATSDEESAGIRHNLRGPGSPADAGFVEDARHTMSSALHSSAEQAVALRDWRKRYLAFRAELEARGMGIPSVGQGDARADALLREYFPDEEDRRRTFAELGHATL